MARWKFRGLPMNLAPHRSTREVPIPEDLWCISGVYEGEGGIAVGVLEWCYDKDDANTLLTEMKKDSRFSGLSARLWKESQEDL